MLFAQATCTGKAGVRKAGWVCPQPCWDAGAILFTSPQDSFPVTYRLHFGLQLLARGLRLRDLRLQLVLGFLQLNQLARVRTLQGREERLCQRTHRVYIALCRAQEKHRLCIFLHRGVSSHLREACATTPRKYEGRLPEPQLEKSNGTQRGNETGSAENGMQCGNEPQERTLRLSSMSSWRFFQRASFVRALSASASACHDIKREGEKTR